MKYEEASSKAHVLNSNRGPVSQCFPNVHDQREARNLCYIAQCFCICSKLKVSYFWHPYSQLCRINFNVLGICEHHEIKKNLVVVFLNHNSWLGGSLLEWGAEAQQWHFSFVFTFCLGDIGKKCKIMCARPLPQDCHKESHFCKHFYTTHKLPF